MPLGKSGNVEAPAVRAASEFTREASTGYVPGRLFWALGVALLIPIWVAPHFPTEDGLAHLYWVDVFRQLGDPQNPWAPFFERNVHWNMPHQLLYFALQYVLSAVVEPHLAQKIIVSALILAWVASVHLLSKSIAGGLTLGALVSLLLVHGAWMYGGFFAFLLGVPILLLTLALLVGIFRPESAVPSSSQYLLLAVLGVAAYFTHLFVAALIVLLFILAVAFFWRRFPSRSRAVALTAVPTVLLIASYLVGSSLGRGGALRWEPVQKAAARFIGLAFFRGFGTTDPLFFLALALLGLILAVLCIGALRAYLKGELPEVRRFILFVAACLAALYVVSPERVGRAGNFNGRLQFAMWLWLLPSLPYRMSARMRALVTAGVCLLLLWQVVDFSLRARRFNEVYAPVLASAKSLPPGSILESALQYENARFERSFIHVLAHTPEDLSYHCRCVLLSSFFPALPFYWVRERPGAAATPRRLVDYERRGFRLSLVIGEPTIPTHSP